MKDILNIILIEDDSNTCLELERYFRKCEDMNLIGITADANVGLRLVRAHLPNVILLDLELHHGGGNGLLFLNDLRNLAMEHTPYIIVTTNNMSDVTLEQARALGADLILTKYENNYSPEYIATTIRLMYDAILRKNTSIPRSSTVTPAQIDNLTLKRVQREMDFIGINPKSKGYNYLVDAILNHMEDPSINLARSLVGKYEKSEKSIERAMQNAIKRAWDTNDIDELLDHYTARIDPDRGVPTLMEFVSHYATRIKTDMAGEKLGLPVR